MKAILCFIVLVWSLILAIPFYLIGFAFGLVGWPIYNGFMACQDALAGLRDGMEAFSYKVKK